MISAIVMTVMAAYAPTLANSLATGVAAVAVQDPAPAAERAPDAVAPKLTQELSPELAPESAPESAPELTQEVGPMPPPVFVPPAAGMVAVPDEAAKQAVVAQDAPTPLVAAPLAFADLTDGEIFDRAAQSIEGIKTLRAQFAQFSPSGTETTGTVSLSRPGRLRFDYDAPNPQLIVASGGFVYVHDAELETTDSYPVAKTPLKFLLDRKLDRDAADLGAVYRSEDGVAVVLQPRDENLQGELALVFSAPDMALVEWAVFAPSGRATRVTLSEVEMDVKLSGRLFRRPDDGGSFLRDR